MSRLSIKSASSGKRSHQYNTYSVGSFDFSDLVTTQLVEVVPGDVFSDIHAVSELRLAPQNFPPFGRLFFKSAAFFVKHSQIWDNADAFHAHMSVNEGSTVVEPVFDILSIPRVFWEHRSGAGQLCTATSQGTPASWTVDPDTYDMVYVVNSSGTAVYYTFSLNSRGSKFFKIFKSLGYDIPRYPLGSISSEVNGAVSQNVSAVALLSYAKVYCDFFMSGPQYNSSPLVALLHSIKHGQNFSYSGYTNIYNASTGVLDYHALDLILSSIKVPHERNMYTEAWNSPNSPLGLLSDVPSDISMDSKGPVSPFIPTAELSEPDNQFINTDPNTVSLKQYTSNGSLNFLSKLGLNALQGVYDLVKRWNLFGSKAAQRLLAQLGIRVDDYTSRYATKLAEASKRIRFSACLSNADTTVTGDPDGRTLGSYAGYGYLDSLDFHYNYQSKDYGTLLVLSWLQIIPINPHGLHPHTLRLNPLDYWTPKFDGKAIRAIPYMELCAGKVPGSNAPSKSVFGFTNLYDDYRNLRDNVFGDFLKKGVRDFAFMRDFSILQEKGLMNQAQTNIIQYYDDVDNPEMSDPFQMSASNGDRFYIESDFEIQSNRDIVSDAQAIDLDGDGDVQLPVLGNQIQ